ncbi:unnamed protein product [Arctogadus glacialis]
MVAPRGTRRTLSLLCLLVVCLDRTLAWDLVLLHTNDVHARMEPTSRESGKCVPAKAPCFAGVARRSWQVNEIRNREKNVLLLDAGDQFQGSVWFNFYKGAEAAFFMNRLRYDAMALGNHEFDNGVEGLVKPFLEDVRFPVLSANLNAASAPKIDGRFEPYKILTVDGQKVGIVGYTSQETPSLSQPGPNLVFGEEVAAVQRQVDKLLTLGVNKVIALGHSGFTKDQEIARKVRGLDAVIGGHTNTFLYTGPPPSNEVPAGDYPFLVQSDHGGTVPVVQAYAFGKYLGYLKLTFDQEGNVMEAKGNPILLDSNVPEDASVAAEVATWRQNLTVYSSTTVGKTLVFLNGTFEECRFRECNLGNLICDAMVRLRPLGMTPPPSETPPTGDWWRVAMVRLRPLGMTPPPSETPPTGDWWRVAMVRLRPLGMTPPPSETPPTGDWWRVAMVRLRPLGMTPPPSETPPTGDWWRVAMVRLRPLGMTPPPSETPPTGDWWRVAMVRLRPLRMTPPPSETPPTGDDSSHLGRRTLPLVLPKHSVH